MEEDQKHNNNSAAIVSSPSKMPYVFGSSTPREFSYMSHVPAELRVYDAKFMSRESRQSRQEDLATFREFLKQARCQSSSPSTIYRQRRGRSADPSRRRHRSKRATNNGYLTDDCSQHDTTTGDISEEDDFYDTDCEYDYVFGSSTPRKWSHLEKLPICLRIYDVELFPHLRRHKSKRRTKKRSRTLAGPYSTVVSSADSSQRSPMMIHKAADSASSSVPRTNIKHPPDSSKTRHSTKTPGNSTTTSLSTSMHIISNSLSDRSPAVGRNIKLDKSNNDKIVEKNNHNNNYIERPVGKTIAGRNASSSSTKSSSLLPKSASSCSSTTAEDEQLLDNVSKATEKSEMDDKSNYANLHSAKVHHVQINEVKKIVLGKQPQQSSVSQDIASPPSSPCINVHLPIEQQTTFVLSEVASQLESEAQTRTIPPSTMTAASGTDAKPMADDSLSTSTVAIIIAGSVGQQENKCLDFAMVQSVVFADDATQFTSKIQKTNPHENAKLMSMIHKDESRIIKAGGDDDAANINEKKKKSIDDDNNQIIEQKVENMLNGKILPDVRKTIGEIIGIGQQQSTKINELSNSNDAHFDENDDEEFKVGRLTLHPDNLV